MMMKKKTMGIWIKRRVRSAGPKGRSPPDSAIGSETVGALIFEFLWGFQIWWNNNCNMLCKFCYFYGWFSCLVKLCEAKWLFLSLKLDQWNKIIIRNRNLWLFALIRWVFFCYGTKPHQKWKWNPEEETCTVKRRFDVAWVGLSSVRFGLDKSIHGWGFGLCIVSP